MLCLVIWFCCCCWFRGEVLLGLSVSWSACLLIHWFDCLVVHCCLFLVSMAGSLDFELKFSLRQ